MKVENRPRRVHKIAEEEKERSEERYPFAL
jgi:hypothetical protein